MIKPATLKRPAKTRSWPVRLVNVMGAVAVTLVIMWQTGLTSRQWWDWAKTPKPAPIALAPVQPPTKAIGIAPPTPRGNDTSSSPVPLQLILVQTHPGMNVHEGTAQMGTVRESPQTYQAGALLENGARLAEIHTDYVLLQKGARAVRLYLETSPASAKTFGNAMTVVGGTNEPYPSTKPSSREVLTEYIRPSPLYDGTVLRGYQVYAGQQAGVFGQLGLQPGDVITAINGARLVDPDSAIGQLQELTEGIAVSATIERKGETTTINLDGAIIVNSMERERDAAAARGAAEPPPI